MSERSLPVPGWLSRLTRELREEPPTAFTHLLPPPGGGRRSSAVLILFAPAERPDEVEGYAAVDHASSARRVGETVVLTQRAATMRRHAGQVSFPGGGHEPEDIDEVATALREATEEIGLVADEVTVLTTLPPLHLAVSGYDVTPVLAWWHRPGVIYPRQVTEVERVLRVPIADLVDPDARFRVRHPSGYTGPAFGVQDCIVWGFTAGVLDVVLETAGLTRPWDTRRIRDID